MVQLFLNVHDATGGYIVAAGFGVVGKELDELFVAAFVSEEVVGVAEWHVVVYARSQEQDWALYFAHL